MRRTLTLVLAVPVSLALMATTSAPSDTAASQQSHAASSDGAPPRTPGPLLAGPGSVDAPAAGPALDPPAIVASPTATPGTTSDDSGPVPPPADVAATGLTRSPEGFLVAAGSSSAGTGPTWRYTVEVEASTGLDPAAVAAAVETALHDDRSWARSRTLVRVDDPSLARLRVVVASPATVDALCARAGLDTAGIYSCWNGTVAALNAWRWDTGTRGFASLADYRTYLVNHEVGHGLGYGHVGCPSPGALAPVMMQQTKGLGGCEANGWPYP
jgi:hypothetical protein